MSDLIAAFQIFMKYGDVKYPTACRHDELIVGVDPGTISAEDKAELERLGFIPSVEYEECFISFRFGSM